MLGGGRRWLFVGRSLYGLDMWYTLHRGVQLSAMLFLAAGAWTAFAAFEWAETPEGAVGNLHKYLGIFLIFLSVVQLLVAAIRPKQTDPERAEWNTIHWNLGRGMLLLSWVVVAFGLALYHEGWELGVSALAWAVPLLAIAAGWVAAEVYLSRMKARAAAGQDRGVASLKYSTVISDTNGDDDDDEDGEAEYYNANGGRAAMIDGAAPRSDDWPPTSPLSRGNGKMQALEIEEPEAADGAEPSNGRAANGGGGRASKGGRSRNRGSR